MSLKDEFIAAIRAANAQDIKPVTIKGFPQFYVRPSSIGEVDERRKEQDEWSAAHTLTMISAYVVCDADGKLLFNLEDQTDVEFMKNDLFKSSFPRMQKILKAMNILEDEPGN